MADWVRRGARGERKPSSDFYYDRKFEQRYRKTGIKTTVRLITVVTLSNSDLPSVICRNKTPFFTLIFDLELMKTEKEKLFINFHCIWLFS